MKSGEEIEKMITLYSKGLRIKDVAQQCESNHTTVSKYLKQAGAIRPRGFQIPHKNNAFYGIDEETSYWLGFIAADGYIRETKHEKYPNCFRRGLRVELDGKDSKHLERLKDFIGEGSIFSRKRDSCSYFFVDRKYIVDNLKQWLPINNKTEMVTIPSNLSESLKGHFLRGYIDGDGSVNPAISITSCPQMLDSIDSFLNLPYRKYTKKNNLASTIVFNKCESLAIYKRVEGVNPLRLNRKWKKIEEAWI